MIGVTAAVEHHLFQSALDGTLRHELADTGSLLRFVQPINPCGAQLRIQRGCRNQRIPQIVINHLSVDMLQAAKNIQTRTLCRSANVPADACMAALASYPTYFIGH